MRINGPFNIALVIESSRLFGLLAGLWTLIVVVVVIAIAIEYVHHELNLKLKLKLKKKRPSCANSHLQQRPKLP